MDASADPFDQRLLFEARVALTAILDRLPNLRVDPDAPPPTITGLAFRSPRSLAALVA